MMTRQYLLELWRLNCSGFSPLILVVSPPALQPALAPLSLTQSCLLGADVSRASAQQLHIVGANISDIHNYYLTDLQTSPSHHLEPYEYCCIVTIPETSWKMFICLKFSLHVFTCCSSISLNIILSIRKC